MPTLLADGRYHTTARGKWSTNTDPAVVQIAGRQRFEATFFRLQSVPPPSGAGLAGRLGGTCCFAAGIKPRFVTYFDPTDPDRMKGFIQPYADTGSVRTNPPTAADPFSGNHVPLKAVDPLATLPPCAPANGSLGTYHFVIPRIKA